VERGIMDFETAKLMVKLPKDFNRKRGKLRLLNVSLPDENGTSLFVFEGEKEGSRSVMLNDEGFIRCTCIYGYCNRGKLNVCTHIGISLWMLIDQGYDWFIDDVLGKYVNNSGGE
jgi:hypothetical protein